MCWHKWTKWKQVPRREIFTWGKLAGQVVDASYQQRQCEKCGKLQEERI